MPKYIHKANEIPKKTNTFASKCETGHMEQTARFVEILNMRMLVWVKKAHCETQCAF